MEPATAWTLSELVAEATARVTALPAPKNGQVRAVPDERTIRYYAALGLLDRPLAMRGRTALYGRRHLAQILAIKRLQGVDRSLAEIRELWPTLDDQTLERMSGINLASKVRGPRKEFWKRGPASSKPTSAHTQTTDVAPTTALAPMPDPRHPLELRVELAPNATLVVALAADSHVSISPADVRALRTAAEPLIAELAARGLAGLPPKEDP